MQEDKTRCQREYCSEGCELGSRRKCLEVIDTLYLCKASRDETRFVLVDRAICFVREEGLHRKVRDGFQRDWIDVVVAESAIESSIPTQT